MAKPVLSRPAGRVRPYDGTGCCSFTSAAEPPPSNARSGSRAV